MAVKKIDKEKLEQAAEVFKGFGNPIRILIINELHNRKLRVMEISKLLGYTQPIISQQLKILKSVGIVYKIREGNSSRYALTSHHFSDMIKCMRSCLGI
ncbi:MAG: winged helix-turn-helix transcriptional regulator [Candidatus Latescibacteria bacterium]|nr:winged helix-turn-helix transcriptional regulator [Candidatus Latescibacterota bacterium]